MTDNIDLERLLELYKSGRYQCDIWFYESLISLVKSLQMHEFVPDLETNYKCVHKIYQLTQQNSDSLNDDFDEQEAASKAEQIKKYIHKLDTSYIDRVMHHCQKQRYTSYTHHAAKLIAKYNYHPKYQQIAQNIINSVHDPELRVEEMMICTLFMLRNAQKIEQILALYGKAIENSLILMKEFRKNSNHIKNLIKIIKSKSQASTHSEIQEDDSSQNKQQCSQAGVQKVVQLSAKLRNYCFGIYFIYTTTTRLCDLVKIFQGKNNFILKLNSYKPDVEQVVQMWQKFDMEQSNSTTNLKSIEDQMDYLPIRQLKDLFIGQKTGVQMINKTCKICLRAIRSQESSSKQYHTICQESMKELISPQK